MDFASSICLCLITVDLHDTDPDIRKRFEQDSSLPPQKRVNNKRIRAESFSVKTMLHDVEEPERYPSVVIEQLGPVAVMPERFKFVQRIAANSTRNADRMIEQH